MSKQLDLTDEQLELWGEVYVQCNFGLLYGVWFHEFLENPRKHLARVGQDAAPQSILNGFPPLLPAQLEVKKRIDSIFQEQETLMNAVEPKQEALALDPGHQLVLEL